MLWMIFSNQDKKYFKSMKTSLRNFEYEIEWEQIFLHKRFDTSKFYPHCMLIEYWDKVKCLNFNESTLLSGLCVVLRWNTLGHEKEIAIWTQELIQW